MTSKERVKAVIEGRGFDRIPVYAWVRANLEEALTKDFGSVEAFEDRYEFDFAHIFGGPLAITEKMIKETGKSKADILPSDVLQIEMCDADETGAWDGAKKTIDFYGKERGRFTYMQSPGIFEYVNGYFGIENHLMYTALYPDDVKRLYAKQAQWNVRFAMNALDLGVDMVHVSDDWGGQSSLLFSPVFWEENIAPNHKLVIDAVHARGAYASLHSDGNINQVLGGIAELGYDVIHPYQVSAGMDYGKYFDKYSANFAIMGGIDVQTTLGFGRPDGVKKEIDNALGLFKNRGLLLCTSHFVQDHCSIDELAYAYDYIYKRVRE